MRIVLAAEPTGGGVMRHVLDLGRRPAAPRLSRAARACEARNGPRVRRAARARTRVRVRDGERRAAAHAGKHDVAATVALRRVIRDFGGADVLHGHSSKAGALARLAQWSHARRVVYTPNGWYTLNPKLGRDVARRVPAHRAHARRRHRSDHFGVPRRGRACGGDGDRPSQAGADRERDRVVVA